MTGIEAAAVPLLANIAKDAALQCVSSWVKKKREDARAVLNFCCAIVVIILIAVIAQVLINIKVVLVIMGMCLLLLRIWWSGIFGHDLERQAASLLLMIFAIVNKVSPLLFWVKTFQRSMWRQSPCLGHLAFFMLPLQLNPLARRLDANGHGLIRARCTSLGQLIVLLGEVSMDYYAGEWDTSLLASVTQDTALILMLPLINHFAKNQDLVMWAVSLALMDDARLDLFLEDPQVDVATALNFIKEHWLSFLKDSVQTLDLLRNSMPSMTTARAIVITRTLTVYLPLAQPCADTWKLMLSSGPRPSQGHITQQLLFLEDSWLAIRAVACVMTLLVALWDCYSHWKSLDQEEDFAARCYFFTGVRIPSFQRFLADMKEKVSKFLQSPGNPSVALEPTVEEQQQELNSSSGVGGDAVQDGDYVLVICGRVSAGKTSLIKELIFHISSGRVQELPELEVRTREGSTVVPFLKRLRVPDQGDEADQHIVIADTPGTGYSGAHGRNAEFSAEAVQNNIDRVCRIGDMFLIVVDIVGDACFELFEKRLEDVRQKLQLVRGSERWQDAWKRIIIVLGKADNLDPPLPTPSDDEDTWYENMYEQGRLEDRLQERKRDVARKFHDRLSERGVIGAGVTRNDIMGQILPVSLRCAAFAPHQARRERERCSFGVPTLWQKIWKTVHTEGAQIQADREDYIRRQEAWKLVIRGAGGALGAGVLAFAGFAWRRSRSQRKTREAADTEGIV